MEFIKQPNDYLFPGEVPLVDDSMLQQFAPALGPVEKLYTPVYLSDDGKLWIARYRVMFGYRLRAGHMRNAERSNHLDLCCGPHPEPFDTLYKVISRLIQHNVVSGLGAFMGLPRITNVKPYYNDSEYVDYIAGLIREIHKKHSV